LKFLSALISFNLVACIGLGPTLAHAAPPAEPDSVAVLPSTRENIFQTYFRDLYSPFVDPLTLSIFAGGTISTVTLLATGKDFEDHVLERASTEKPLGDTSQYGDIAGQMAPNVLYFVYYGGSYLFTKDPLSAFRAEMMFRATLAATSLSTILKTTVREPRPGVSNELTSFPSGHATSIFAFATTVAAMHGVYWGAGAFGLASFVAFSRMNDNRHRLHDVVAGATIGSMYGLSVYQRMRNAAVPSDKTAKSFDYEFVPVATDDGAILGLSATF
jgi:membrane-associated phospholipid phosphatase